MRRNATAKQTKRREPVGGGPPPSDLAVIPSPNELNTIYSSGAPIIVLSFSATAIGGEAPYSYAWSGGNTPNQAANQLTVPRGTLGTDDFFELYITVTDANGDTATSIAGTYHVYWV